MTLMLLLSLFIVLCISWEIPDHLRSDPVGHYSFSMVRHRGYNAGSGISRPSPGGGGPPPLC